MYAAVEAGGTKCRAAIFDDKIKIVDQKRVATSEPTETLESLIEFFKDKPDLKSLGVAPFGPLIVDRLSPDYGSFAKTPKPGWSDAPILKHLADSLALPTDIQTDVEAPAVAEGKLGAGRGKRQVAYVTVGTGIGGAVAVDGVPYRGVDHSEIGHIPVKRIDGDDFAGNCPFHGDCLEGMASGPAIADRWGAEATELLGKDEVWELEAGYLAQLVRTFVYTFSPEVVIFGGGVALNPGVVERIQTATRDELGGYTVSQSDTTLAVAAELGADAGLYGAALLAQSIA